jgi:LPS sulfotransferase NodH
MIEADLREVDMQEQLDRWGVVPNTLVYEDLIARYQSTLRELFEFLQISGREGITIPAPAFPQMADEVSEAWFQRFRCEWAANSNESRPRQFASACR